HWIVGIRRLLQAVVDQGDTVKAAAYFADLRQPTDVIRSGSMFVGILVGDIIITYRIWLGWGRDYRVIILPTFTVIGLTGRDAPFGPSFYPLIVLRTPSATVVGLMYRMLAATSNESIFAAEFNR
ncbi:uncharacterized protein TRAVEDRAFT_114431, partial [Trametes versicolor FP-101664 SS1]|uniref:uncharacterized protein n=1 Tax=Trametes versicolor (strain FP-101664) TaxID=717944 RepID=UPI000462418A